VVSTLDLKRTFLALFAWNALPKPLIERIGAFRAAPGIARLLVALESLPAITDDADLRRPLLFGGSPTEAYRAWSGGIIPASPPAVLRVVSAVDPFLAPDGAAVVTVTLGGTPHPFRRTLDQRQAEPVTRFCTGHGGGGVSGQRGEGQSRRVDRAARY
jgi:phytoene dehydrogenase-like protein